MKQLDINTLISKSLSGKLSDDEETLLNKYLANDARLCQKYILLQESRELIRRYNVYSAIDKNKAKTKFKKEHSIYNCHSLIHYMSYAAAITLIIIICTLLYNSQDKIERPILSNEISQAINKAEAKGKNNAIFTLKGKQRVTVCSDSAIAAMTANNTDAEGTLVTLHDKEFWLTLDDGTRVHLNYNTTLTYPMKFNGNKRIVSLDGEAFFFVAKDSKRPFYVKTRNGTVKEYGTHFDVNTREIPGSTEVVLVEGSISVITCTGKEWMIKPGQKAILHESSEDVNVENVDTNPYKAWNEGRFVFEDYPLSKLMDVLSHWYGRKIKFKSQNTYNMHFTGTLDRYGDLSDLLKAIEDVTDVKITDDGYTIEIK